MEIEKTPFEEIKEKLEKIKEYTKNNKPKIMIYKKINEINEIIKEIEMPLIEIADIIFKLSEDI